MASANDDHTQFFGRIRLHGLTKTSDGTPCPIDLNRRPSFPMPAKSTSRLTTDHDKDLSARPLAPRYDIEARVCFERPIIQDGAEGKGLTFENLPRHALGYGRAGIVYPLEILSFNRATSDDRDPLSSSSISEEIEPPTLPPLCVKVATPGYARNHAREAWFYEQFQARGLIGLVAPRCYGVFHISKVPDNITLDIQGYDYYGNASKHFLDEPGLYTACMREELYDLENKRLYCNTLPFIDDNKGSYTKSEWKEFRETPAVTTMTVLIMDMLGRCITVEDFEKDWEGDINDIWDHLAPLDIVHEDIRFPNVLRVPPHLQVPCPMHPNAGSGHKWNITDWESGTILCVEPTNCIGVWDQRLNLCSYYRRLGGKLKLTRKWKDYFKYTTKTKEYVYLGPDGLHEDRVSNQAKH